MSNLSVTIYQGHDGYWYVVVNINGEACGISVFATQAEAEQYAAMKRGQTWRS